MYEIVEVWLPNYPKKNKEAILDILCQDIFTGTYFSMDCVTTYMSNYMGKVRSIDKLNYSYQILTHSKILYTSVPDLEHKSILLKNVTVLK